MKMKIAFPKTKKTRIIAASVLGAVLLLLAVVVYLGMGQETRYPSSGYTLLPREYDAAGIDDIRGFELKIPEGTFVTEEDIRANLTVEPAFSYFLVPDGRDYILKPNQPLEAGQTYTLIYQDGEESYSFSYQVRQEPKILTCSLDQSAGIALDAPLVITFAGGSMAHPEDDIEISPKVDGEWTVTEDAVTFQPVKWQDGTYYQVEVAVDAEMNGIDRTLGAGASFSFETQNPADRIPTSDYFTAENIDLTILPGAEIQIPVSYYHVDNAKALPVTMEIWAFPDEESYLEGFGPIYALPSWATYTRSQTQVETKGLDKIGRVETQIQTGDADSYVVYDGTLDAGTYLFRLELNDQSVDIAVHVSRIDGTSFVSDGTLHVWCHRDGEALSGAKVTWAGKKLHSTKKGYGALPIAETGGQRQLFYRIHDR